MLVCLFLHRAIKFTSRRAYDNAQRALTRAGRVYNLEKVICFFLINGIVIFVFGKGKFSSLVLITVYGCIADSAYRVGCCASKFLWWKNCKSIFFSFPILVICLSFWVLNQTSWEYLSWNFKSFSIRILLSKNGGLCINCRLNMSMHIWNHAISVSTCKIIYAILVSHCSRYPAYGCYFISCILYVVLSIFLVICKLYKERKVWSSTSNWVFLQDLIFFKRFLGITEFMRCFASIGSNDSCSIALINC